MQAHAVGGNPQAVWQDLMVSSHLLNESRLVTTLSAWGQPFVVLLGWGKTLL